MAQTASIKLFQDKNVRTVWDEEQEKWYFSIIDVIAILTDQPDYQKVLKQKQVSPQSQVKMPKI